MEVGKVPEQAKSMMTVSLEGGQTPLAMVHTSTLLPETSPVTVAAGLFTFEKEIVPETALQVPVPVVGALAARVVVEAFTVWLGPALAVLGAGSTVTVVPEEAAVQPLLPVTTTL
jgi:hypothetical protein